MAGARGRIGAADDVALDDADLDDADLPRRRAGPPGGGNPVPPRRHSRRARDHMAPAALLAALLLVVQQPWRAATALPRNIGDPAFVTWVLSWGSHALHRAPRQLFDAPIFWPHHTTLAYSEPLLGLAPLWGLAEALTSSWTLATGIVVLACTAAGLAGTYALGLRLTGQRSGAALAAIIFGFGGLTLGQWGHVQLQAVCLLPLALLVLLHLVERPTARSALALAAVQVAMVVTTSSVALSWAVGATTGVLALAIHRRLRLGAALTLALGGAVVATALVALPVVHPYLRLQHEAAFRRSGPPLATLRLTDVLAPPPGALVHLLPVRGERGAEEASFPGVVPLVLGGLGAAAALTRRRARAATADPAAAAANPLLEYPTRAARGSGTRERGAGPGRTADLPRAAAAPAPAAANPLLEYPTRAARGSGTRERGAGPGGTADLLLVAAAGVACLAVAVGPWLGGAWSPYSLLHAHVPGFSGLRVSSRFAVVSLLSLGLFAGRGLAVLTSRAGSPVAARAIGVVALVLAAAELCAPVRWAHLRTDARTLAVYRELDRRPGGAVLELPALGDRDDGWDTVEAPRMLYARLDDHPRVNGYSGSTPPGFDDLTALVNRFPEPCALHQVHLLGVRWVILHGRAADPRGAWPASRIDTALAALPAAAATRRADDTLLDVRMLPDPGQRPGGAACPPPPAA